LSPPQETTSPETQVALDDQAAGQEPELVGVVVGVGDVVPVGVGDGSVTDALSAKATV
jgi:hypothetical protein